VVPAVVDRCLAILDAAERTRLARFTSPDLRRRFAVSHGATRQILARYADRQPTAVRYRFGPWGKPELADHPSLHHNLTHSADLALLAVSTHRPVGVDVERLRTTFAADALAHRFYPPPEAGAVAARRGAEQRWLYLRFWTRKEACGKASGMRLDQALRLPVDVASAGFAVRPPAAAPDAPTGWWVTDVLVESGFLAATALLGGTPYDVEVKTWEPPA
jgi:4'-phosphopantetheinyl transferase